MHHHTPPVCASALAAHTVMTPAPARTCVVLVVLGIPATWVRCPGLGSYGLVSRGVDCYTGPTRHPPAGCLQELDDAHGRCDGRRLHEHEAQLQQPLQQRHQRIVRCCVPAELLQIERCSTNAEHCTLIFLISVIRQQPVIMPCNDVCCAKNL